MSVDNPTWEHPQLGGFTYDPDSLCWCSVPGNALEASLQFRVDDEDDGGTTSQPSDAAAELAYIVYQARRPLEQKVAQALWLNFLGQGPKSGMWWQGRLDEVREALAFHGCRAPENPTEVGELISLSGITVDDSDRRGPPSAQIWFSAKFEQEHGVGALTDGHSILGLGYAEEAAPFEQPQENSKNLIGWPEHWNLKGAPTRGDFVVPERPDTILQALREQLEEKKRVARKFGNPNTDKSVKKHEGYLKQVQGTRVLKVQECRRILQDTDTYLAQWLPYICEHHGLKSGVEVFLLETDSRPVTDDPQTQGGRQRRLAAQTLRRRAITAGEDDYRAAAESFRQRLKKLTPEQQAIIGFVFQE